MSETIQDIVEKLVLERNRLELQLKAIQDAMLAIQGAYLARGSAEEDILEGDLPEDIAARLPTTTTKRRGRPRGSASSTGAAAPPPLSHLSIPEAITQILEEGGGTHMRPMEIQKALMKGGVHLSKKYPQQQISRVLNTGSQFKKVGKAWTVKRFRSGK